MGKINIILLFVLALGLLAEGALYIENESELREAQSALFNVNSEAGWLLLNYVSPNTVHFAAGGEGGTNDVLRMLEDDQIQYILIRVRIEEGLSKSTIRDVFITWIGPRVGILEKGKKMAYLADAEALLQPFHSSLTALNRDNFNQENIIDRSNPLSGSHVIN